MSAMRRKADSIQHGCPGLFLAINGHSRRCPTSPGMTAFDTTRTLRRMFNGTAYLDRAAPRLAAPKFLVLAFTRGPFIELAPGSNCPGRIFWPSRSTLAARFLAFCAAFAFARWRAIALVMSSSPHLYSFRGIAPSRQFAWYLQLGQTRSPGQELTKGLRHFKQRRNLGSLPRSGSGFNLLLAAAVMLHPTRSTPRASS